MHEKSLECNTCHKRFHFKSELKDHELTHSGEKSFVCFNKSFNSKTHVKTVHEKKKDFKCDICGKEFVRNSYLEKHMIEAHENAKNTIVNDSVD